MTTISVKHDFDKLVGRLADTAKRQVPYAASVALNAVAEKVKAAEEHEMRDVLDRPTPYTMSSVYLKRATKQALVAEVGLKDFSGKGTPATKFLSPLIKGGTRRLKRFERALRSVGALPDGYVAVPGSAARLDAFGNMDRGQIVQILSFFKAFPEAGYKANMSPERRKSLAKGSKKKQGFAYFVGRPGNGRGPLGIWQRVYFASGTAVKPVIIFVPHAIYQAIFDFEYVAQNVAGAAFSAEFGKALDEALRTAR